MLQTVTDLQYYDEAQIVNGSPQLYYGGLRDEGRLDPTLIRQQHTDPESYNSLPIEPGTPTSRKKLTWHDLNKPLPPVPRFPRYRPQIGGIRLALTTKSANSKSKKDNGIIESSPWKHHPYHKLSSPPGVKPVLQISAPTSHTTANSRSNNETIPALKMHDSPASSNTSDAVAELGRKLEELMAKQAPSNQTSPASGVEKTNNKGRRTNFRSGRKAIDRFKYVLSDRLGGGSGVKQRGTTKASGLRLRNESWEFVADDEAEKGWRKAKKRSENRPIEGRSLSDSTVQSMVIKHMIPRKPVPGKHDGKGSEEGGGSTSLPEDPFADDMEMQGLPQLEFSPLNLDLTLDYRASHSDAGLLKPELQNANVSEHSPGTSSGFSADVSGLDSQSGLDLSSSSPAGYSTPRIKLESKVEANGMRRLASVPSRTTSLLGSFDFELGAVSSKESEPRNVRSDGEATTTGLKRKSSSRLSGVGIFTPPHKKQKKQSLTQEGGKGSFSSHARSDSSLLPKPSHARAKALLRWGKAKGLAVLDSSRG